MVKVKICGITNHEDALAAIDAGADSLGFVFHEKSPRNVSPQRAAAIIAKLPPFVQTVGLFVDADVERVNWVADFCGLDLVQLHGDEDPDYCPEIRRRIIKAFRVKDAATLKTLARYQVAGYLLDAWSPSAHGGTGTSFDWSLARELAGNRPIILAGGLTPENVRDALDIVRPYAVDVSSGVEAAPGRKDPDKIRAFIRAVKGY
ncbi:phosphoribosylanthranilate isomerase [Geobacter pelophilus]|uniref:N-(5'-phosphoribosyl)anthranilate isomerase n=1 Tax=Geoanaerobacter pelophilus TaxID=60036 RepID=A0AAW4KX51_9BACT|nr:phosphoribosylanthranilate isomerase [Geoanaerobacter pelophilus]MBT0663198.1 phosphoribosylanthranilate isomerase [Geoanaerobacter pelophilus]